MVIPALTMLLLIASQLISAESYMYAASYRSNVNAMKPERDKSSPSARETADQRNRTTAGQSTRGNVLRGEVLLIKGGQFTPSGARRFASFDNSWLRETFEVIGVDRERWVAWEQRTDYSEPLSDVYPKISKLAWWFVDPVQFDQSELPQLERELLDIQKSASNREVHMFVEVMLNAVHRALETGDSLGVYP
jgi:hypothetical protein